MVAPAIVAGGLAAGASLAGGVLQSKTQQKVAREQMAFQERMSNTAYRRAVHDMRLAGINPMLAYMQGGASSPSGAQPTIPDVVGPAVSSAMHARRLHQELKNMKASALKDQATAQLEYMRRDESMAHKRLLDADRKLREAELPYARNRAAVERTKFGEKMHFVDRVMRSLFGGSGPGVLLAPGLRRPAKISKNYYPMSKKR